MADVLAWQLLESNAYHWIVSSKLACIANHFTSSRLGEYPQVRLKILSLRQGKLRLYHEAHREELIYTRVPDKP